MAGMSTTQLLRQLFLTPSILLVLGAILASFLGLPNDAAPILAYALPIPSSTTFTSQPISHGFAPAYPSSTTRARGPSFGPSGPNGLRVGMAGTFDEQYQPVPQEPAVRPRPDLKTLRDPKIDSRVVEAIDKLKGKVTVADVASAAGVDLQTASTNVRDMAYLTGAAIIVSESGELLYDFGRAPSAKLASVSARASLSQTWQAISPYLAKGVRIGFGLALFASLALVFVTLFMFNVAVGGSSQEEDEESGGGGGGGGFMHHHTFFGPSFWILPTPYYGPTYYDPYYDQGGYVEERPQRKMSFFEAVYSFVFGDGNPNFNLDERRYQMIAQLIRNNDGAVVAEQLAPYLDPPQSWFERDPDSVIIDEAFVGPVLTRFNGHAEVTDDGDIVYVFDDLRSTSGGVQSTQVSPYLEEKETHFSRASTGQKWAAAILGGINVFGAMKLGGIVKVLSILTAAKRITLTPFLATVVGLYPFLLAYASVYVAAPVIRWAMMKRANAAAEARNEARYAAAVQLTEQNLSPSTRRKLEGSRKFKGAARDIGSQGVAFRSDVDASLQSTEADALADFDRKLGLA